MLIVKCEEYLAEVKKWAEENGCMDALQNKLDYLDAYGDPEKKHHHQPYAQTHLYKDFAPNSFGFSIDFWSDKANEYRHFMSGGLIYFPPERSCKGEHEWSVHT